MANQPKKTNRKMNYRMRWVVNPYRKDKRTGAIDPSIMDRYTKYNFDQIHKEWHGEKEGNNENVL